MILLDLGFSLHWSGGLGSLKKASAVRDLSVFEKAESRYKKAVFVINGPVVGSTKTTVQVTNQSLILIILTNHNTVFVYQSILEQSDGLEYVVIITNCHPSLQTWAQYPARDWSHDDNTGFDQLEQQVLMWMGNMNYTAEIFYIPLFLVSLTPRLLITPSYSTMFPLLQPDTVRAAALWRTLHPGHSLTCDPGDWPSLPHQLQISVREMVASLHSLLSTLGAKEVR